MPNWYKISFRGNIPKNEDLDEKKKNPYARNPLMTPGSEDTNPSMYGGRERKGFPKGYSAFEDDSVKINNDVPKDEAVLMNLPNASETGNDDLLERFSDPIDKLKNFNYKEPVGAFNMPHNTPNKDDLGVYKRTKQKTKLPGLNWN